MQTRQTSLSQKQGLAGSTPAASTKFNSKLKIQNRICACSPTQAEAFGLNPKCWEFKSLHAHQFQMIEKWQVTSNRWQENSIFKTLVVNPLKRFYQSVSHTQNQTAWKSKISCYVSPVTCHFWLMRTNAKRSSGWAFNPTLKGSSPFVLTKILEMKIHPLSLTPHPSFLRGL